MFLWWSLFLSLARWSSSEVLPTWPQASSLHMPWGGGTGPAPSTMLATRLLTWECRTTGYQHHVIFFLWPIQNVSIRKMCLILHFQPSKASHGIMLAKAEKNYIFLEKKKIPVFDYLLSQDWKSIFHDEPYFRPKFFSWSSVSFMYINWMKKKMQYFESPVSRSNDGLVLIRMH